MAAGEKPQSPWDNILEEYHAMGFALMPVSNKVLTRKVFNYCMANRANVGQLKEWFRADQDAMLAARMGTPSDNIMAIYVENIDPFGPLYGRRVLNETRTILSPLGNHYLLYRFPRCYVGKFSFAPTATLIGEGCLCFLPPSTTNLGYQYKHEIKMPINSAPMEIAMLLSMCATKHRIQKVKRR